MDATRTGAGIIAVLMIIALAFTLGRCTAPAAAQPTTEPPAVESSLDYTGSGIEHTVAAGALGELDAWLATQTTTTTHQPVAPRSAPAAPATSGDRWDQLAQCESGGNWGYPPVAGGFSGGIMFHIGTWHAMGGGEYAPDAYLATREQQIVIAERTLAASGWQAWPG